MIGDRCSIAAGAVVKRFTEIGNDNRIGEYAVLGGLPQDLKFKDKVSYLRLGDRNTIRESVTLHRATAEGGGMIRPCTRPWSLAMPVRLS